MAVLRNWSAITLLVTQARYRSRQSILERSRGAPTTCGWWPSLWPSFQKSRTQYTRPSPTQRNRRRALHMTDTDPNKWFLDSNQIGREPAYTSGNHAEALIDGKDYMSDLSHKLVNMRDGDYFYMGGWRVTPEQRLAPEDTSSPTLADEMQRLISTDVTVKALIWFFPTTYLGIGLSKHARGNTRFVRRINEAGGQAILDGRLPRGTYASHHQKTIVLSSEGVDWAYVGGIDIAVDRWDTSAHDASPHRLKGQFDGWHDVQCVVRGPAVSEIWGNVADRWNDTHCSNVKIRVPARGELSPIETARRPSPQGDAGSQYVQVLRTFAGGNVYSFAPEGETTIGYAYERAIDLAQHYVYIEDQFLWPCSITEKLRCAAARGVKVILVLSHKFPASWHRGTTRCANTHLIVSEETIRKTFSYTTYRLTFRVSLDQTCRSIPN